MLKRFEIKREAEGAPDDPAFLAAARTRSSDASARTTAELPKHRKSSPSWILKQVVVTPGQQTTNEVRDSFCNLANAASRSTTWARTAKVCRCAGELLTSSAATTTRTARLQIGVARLRWTSCNYADVEGASADWRHTCSNHTAVGMPAPSARRASTLLTSPCA